MAIEIKELVSNGSVLVDLTDAESREINGGHSARVAFRTGDFGLASLAGSIVLYKSARDQSVIGRQLAIGVPRDLVEQARIDAIREGRGVYTAQVAFSKLAG